MTKYFVSPAEKSTTWSIAHSDFERLLRQRWPHAKTIKGSDLDRFRALEWTVEAPSGVVEGALNGDGQAIALDGAIGDVARMALWFRSVVPSEQALIFYDEGYNADVELKEGTTVDDLVSPFL